MSNPLLALSGSGNPNLRYYGVPGQAYTDVDSGTNWVFPTGRQPGTDGWIIEEDNASNLPFATDQQVVDGIASGLIVSPQGDRAALNSRFLGTENFVFTDPVHIDDGGECSTLQISPSTIMRWRREAASGQPSRVTWQTASVNDPETWTAATDCIGFPVGEGWFIMVNYRTPGEFIPLVMCLKLGTSGHGPSSHYFYESTDGKAWAVMNDGNPIFTESSDPTNLHYTQYNVAFATDGDLVYTFMDSQAGEGPYQINTFTTVSYAPWDDLSQLEANLPDVPTFPEGVAGAFMPIHIPERSVWVLYYTHSGDNWTVSTIFNLTLKCSVIPDTENLQDGSEWTQLSIAWPNVEQASDPDIFELSTGRVLGHFNQFQDVGTQSFTNASTFVNMYDRLLSLDFIQQDTCVNSLTVGASPRRHWNTIRAEARQDDNGDCVFYDQYADAGLHPPFNQLRYPAWRLGTDAQNDCFWQWNNTRKVTKLGVGNFSAYQTSNLGRVELEGWFNHESFFPALYSFTGSSGFDLGASTVTAFGTGDFTVSFMLNPTTTDGGIRYITTGAGALEISVDGTTLVVRKGGDSASTVEWDYSVVYDELHSYVLIRSLGTLYLYRDGKQMYPGPLPFNQSNSFSANITASISTIGGSASNFLIGNLSRYSETPFNIGETLLSAIFSNGLRYTPLQRGTIAANNILNLSRNSNFSAGATDWFNAGTGSTVTVVSSKLHLVIPTSDDAALLQSTYFGADFEPGKTYTISMDISNFTAGASIRLFSGGQNQAIADRPDPSGTITASFTSIGGGTGLLITVLGNVARTFDVDNVVIRSIVTSYEMEDGCDNAGRQIDDLSGQGRVRVLPTDDSITRLAPSAQGKVAFTLADSGYAIGNERIIPEGYVLTQAAIETDAATSGLYDNSGATTTLATCAPNGLKVIATAIGVTVPGTVFVSVSTPESITGTLFFSKL